MANVRRCDVCGKVYEPNTYPFSDSRPTSSTIMQNVYFIGQHNNLVDLCSECTKRVLEFTDVMRINGPDNVKVYVEENKND